MSVQLVADRLHEPQPSPSAEGFAGSGIAGELGVIYEVLKEYLTREQRYRCWTKWKPILERYPLFRLTPFKNVVAFSNEVARECGLDTHRKLNLRRDLFQTLAQRGANGGGAELVSSDQALSARFRIPGMADFATGTVRRVDRKVLELVSSQGIIVGNPVQMLAKKNDDDSLMRIEGRVIRILAHPDSDASIYTYLIDVDSVSPVPAAA